jgi:AraC family transcriptional regulator of adaptative response/methylated-DNA-[protein]-cysteine methyltransferase
MNREPGVYKVVSTPLGPAVTAVTSLGCALFEFLRDDSTSTIRDQVLHKMGSHCEQGENDLLRQIGIQMDEYFAGKRKEFHIPLDLHGTGFQKSVWNALLSIPPGSTLSYGAIARSLGNPGAARAVGRANGMNPVAVIVPCHRVVQEDGSLGGYAGGLGRKKFLLQLEGAKIMQPAEVPDLPLFSFA